MPQHQFEPVELTGDLRRQLRRQGPTIPRDQLRQALATIRPQRLIVVNPLGGAQSLDPVDQANALLQQRGPLAARTTRILLVRRRRADHGADLRLAAGPGHQRPQQSLGIQAVRLGPPGTAVDLQRTRVHDMAADAVRLEKAVQPEPVAAGLVAARHVRAHAGASFHAGSDAGKQVEHRLSVTGGEPMQLDLRGIGGMQRHQPGAAAEFEGEIDRVGAVRE